MPGKFTILLAGFLAAGLSLPACKSSRRQAVNQERSKNQEPAAWFSTSFLDFADGTLADGGANTYVAADGSIRLINQLDLNRDGYVDVVFANSHDNDETVDLFLYWGKQGFSAARRIQLPALGAKAHAISDLNHDGYLDLIVANHFNGATTRLNSYIFWGSRKGFDPSRRAELPGVGVAAVAVADLDRNGHPDIVFANSDRRYGNGDDRLGQSWIYWGTSEGYSPDRRSAVESRNPRGVKAVDLNGDGFPELVFANEGNSAEESGALIYWGNAGGKFSTGRRTHLPGEGSSALEIADLNSDGFPDIVLANRFRLSGRRPGVYNVIDTLPRAIHSFIYWGSALGYSAPQRTELPTLAASAVAVADLNNDRYPDIVFASGQTGFSHYTASPPADSYVYWGSARGFFAHRRTALPTLSATGCVVHDLNRDGYVDLVFSNESDGQSFEVASYIYWGGAEGFSSRRRAELPTWGAASVGAADLDNDGETDLVFINKEQGGAGAPLEAYIYWGNKGGQYSTDRRQGLPKAFGSPGEGHATADINNDGFVDLYLAGPESLIYWGAADGFAPHRKMLVSPRKAISGRVADFNRDGYLDLVVSDFTEWAPGEKESALYWGGPSGFSAVHQFSFRIAENRVVGVADLDRNGYLDILFPTMAREVAIFWNGPQGFDNARKTTLPCQGAVSLETADLNADGYLDLIVCNLESREGTHDAGTDVWWGSGQRYSQARRITLPSTGNVDASVADLNQDGYLDLVLSSYHGPDVRNLPSYVYWGSNRGLSASRVTRLPTNSAAGVLLTDFNQDGFWDILFACHIREGNHRTDSFLYWGGPDNFTAPRRLQIPALGPHHMATADVGNIYDRRPQYEYISPPFEGRPGTRFRALSWEGETPFRTRLHFQIRAATTRERLDSAPWQGPEGNESYYTRSGSNLGGIPDGSRWIQYKAVLISPDGANSPVLHSVTIR